GYRPNVGIVICNRKGQVLWAKRYGQNSWQFPQGGINDNESAEQAMYRELYEEVGLQPKDVKVLDGWRWVSFWYPVRQVVSFKKDVYRKAMKEFAQVIFGNEKTLLENTQEHETNKPYHAPRKNGFSKYQKRSSYKSRGQ
ncbi:MAG: RNA pyrophosphohydrolase, partial [Haemophilus parainfluenzae]|nr:RNA pyrophosphohydrolase [Haemophilus parainfluenzae]